MYWKIIPSNVFFILTFNLITEVLCSTRSGAIVPLNTMIFWANATVPFSIDKESYDEDQIARILKALKEFESKTCIRFLPVFTMDDHVHHLYITNKKAVRRCQYSTSGHNRYNAHVLVIGYDCLKKPDIETLIMKTLGFSFEHNRPTRDEYITVLYENIQPSAIELFTKDVSYPKELEVLPYDINSVMHFDVREQSFNGYPSILIKNRKFGLQRRPSLSPLDIKKFSIIYGDQCRRRDEIKQVVKCEKNNIKNPSARRHEEPVQIRRTLEQNLTIKAVIESQLFTNIESSTAGETTTRVVPLSSKTEVTEATTKKIAVKKLFTNIESSTAGKTTKGVVPLRSRTKVTNATAKETAVKKGPKPEKTLRVSESRSMPESNDNTVNLIKILNTSKRPSRYWNSYLLRPSEYIKPFSMIDNVYPPFYDHVDQNNVEVETESAFGRQHFESRKSSYVKSGVKIALTDANKKFYDNTKWPVHVIKYIIADDKDGKETVKNRLNQVGKILKSKTCIRLEEISSNEVVLPQDYVVFDKSDNFNFGYEGGKQIFGSIELFSDEQHEQLTAMLVMSLLGFPLECCRHDRDDYIKVNIVYVVPAKRYHFTKQPASATLSLPYDYRSAAHPPYQFWRSKNGTGYSSVATYKRLDPDATIMKSFGHHKELFSKQDIVKINSVYGTECPLFKN